MDFLSIHDLPRGALPFTKEKPLDTNDMKTRHEGQSLWHGYDHANARDCLFKESKDAEDGEYLDLCLHIQGVAESIAHEVDRENCQDQHCAREDDPPPVATAKSVL